MSFSLTESLLASNAQSFQKATKSEFLRRAAQGKVSKETLGQWLANDRLYIHGYIRGMGHLLSAIRLPQAVASDPNVRYSDAPSRLLSWTIDALVNIRREEKFFVDTAMRYGIDVNLPTDADGDVPAAAKLDGLRRFEELFDSLYHSMGPGKAAADMPIMPWLEAAIVFYGTEKCYLEAWSWAKAHLDAHKDVANEPDEDGGAVRNEFIANWTSPEFVNFVDQLSSIIDSAVIKEVEARGEAFFGELMKRCEPKWNELLAAESAFWPRVPQ